MRKLTLLISMLFLSLGMAWAQTATLEVSTNVAYPEYRYRIKSDNGFWMAANTAPTQNNIASFAFFAVSGDFYKIYSIDKGQWVSYDKSNGSDNCKDFVKFANSQDAANAWKITQVTRNNKAVYQIQPQNNDGSVSNRYMNWNAGVGNGGGFGYTYDDTKTVGLWRDNGSADGGSAWILVDNAESVAEVGYFVNGTVYTFVTQRGWMGAMDSKSDVISTARVASAIPAADVKRTNPDFQWTVYKSANNNYYLYNIGKGQFMGVQSENNAAVPFVKTPVGNITFKKSSSGEYPIMFSTDNKAVVNHSANHDFGLISWTGGWNTYDDPGSNHKVVKVGVLDETTIADIAQLVNVYELLPALNAAVSELTALFSGKDLGNGLGQYSSSYENYQTVFAGIKEYAANVPAGATADDIQERIDICKEIKNTFSYNKPVAGKYYRIKAVAEWNDDAPYLGSKNSAAKSGRAEFIANADAYSIFLFDGTSLKSYASGHYLVNNNNFLGYNSVQQNGSSIAFHLASNNLKGAYNISFKGNNDGTRWLYVSQGNYTGAAGSTDGTNGYCFNIEEVANLPVAQSGNNVYYTLADAKANVKAGETLTLFVDTDETIELPIGVILDKNGHSADKVTVATPVAEVGGVEYATLAAAIKAASAGSTITFVADVNENVTLSKNVTIDGANFNYTGTMSANNALTVTVQNVNFVNGGFAKNNSGTSGTYTIKDCTFDGKGTYAYPVLASNIGTLNVENCTVKDYQYGFLYVKKQSTKVSVKSVTVEGCANYAVYLASGVSTATFEELTVKNSNNGILWPSAGARTLNLKNCKFENVKTAINSNGGAYVVTANVQGVKNDFGTAVLSDNVKCVLAEDATLAAPADLNITTDVEGKEVAYQGGKYSVVVKRDPAGHVAYRADVTDKDNREGIAILLKEVYAKNSLVVKVYNGETLMFTCTRRDIDDEDKVMFPVDGNTTANIVLWGKESGSWINEIAVAPTELNVPNRIEIWADDVLVQNYTHESGTILGTNIEKYLALDCVKKFDAKIGNAGYETLAAAVEAAKADETIVLLRDVAASDIITINKAITLDGNGKTLTSTAARAFNIETEGKVVINNLTVNAGERAFNIINKVATVELNDVIATASNNAVMIATSAGAAKVSINGCNFTGLAVVNVAGAGAQVAINETNITNVDANEAENYGAITVSSTATDANVTVNGGSIIVADDSKKAYIFAEGATVTGVDQIGQIVAMIGEAGYETLTEAIADAKEGQTVKMVYDVNLSEILVINKPITLDGNNKTLTSTAARAINIETEGKVVINNLTVKAAERAFNIINKAATVELNDVTATASNNAVMIATSAGAAKVSIDGCDFTGLAVVNVAGAKSNVAIKNSTITNVDANEDENYGAITVWSSAKEAVVKVENTEINVADDSKKAYVFPGDAIVEGVDQIGRIVAMIGEAGYETLTEAIADANAGQTVKMVYDATLSEILVINKAITLDGNGKTLTSTATGTNARAINVSGADGVTIKNLTIDAKGERAINVIQNATNVTIDNVTATAANYTVNVAASAANAVVAISNSNLTGLNVVNVAAPGSEVTINGGTITCNDQNANENYAALAMNKDAVGAKITTTGVDFDIKGDSKTASNGAVDGEITIDGETDGVDVIVAYIQYGNYYNSYTSIEAAIAKAKDGETIGLIRDITASDIITINKAITLDGNGKTLTSTADRAINVETEGEVVIKNLTIDAKGERAFNIINKAATVELNDVTATASNNAVMIATSAGAANVTINRCDFTGLAVVNVAGAGAQVAINDTEITNVDANEAENYGAITVYSTATNANVTVNGGSITVDDDSKKAYIFAEGATVTGVDEVGQIVAMIGDAGYETLTEAIADAKEGQTVKMVYDATGAGVVIDKSITIDFNGKIYTVNQTVGSTGTTTLGLQILKGEDNAVTLKNGTLTSTATVEGSKEVKMLVQNYANLTVDGMKLVDETDHILYVLSNNSGNVNIINGSVITANGDGAIALDACKYANYDAPTVNVAEGVTVNGNVEVSATLNMNGALNGEIIINKATGTVNGAEGLKVKTNVADYKVVRGENGAYTIVEKHYVAQIGEAKYETFAAAVAAAKDGQTITLVDNATESATVVLTKNLTIDGDGKTFTGAIEFNKSNGSFTVKNVNFNGAGTRVYALKSQASTTNLTVENCEVTGYTYGFLYANKAVANAIVNNVTVKDVTYGVHSAYGTNVTLNNFVAENVEYGVMVQNYGTRNVVLNSCSFTGCENPLYIWERNQTNKITFNFKGANEMGKDEFCTSAMAVINADAIVGTKVCGTLADAVEAAQAAQANETVTLLRNAQLSTFLTIDKSITLNMGEYDITRDGGTALYVNGDVEVVINGTTGTVTGSQALWVANGLATVNGGNFCGVAEAVYVTNTGKAVIKGGTFSSSNYDSFVLNKKDSDRGNTDITVYGGTFVGFNPANNAAEGQGTNFVAAGLMGVDNGDGTFGIAKANIKMGDSYYATLAEAIAAIGAGDVVIELLADATLDYGAREAYGTAETTSVTINGNGKTLTLNQTNSDWSSFGLAAGNVVLNDMTIEKTGYGDTSGAWNTHTIIFSSPVEMNDVTVNNSVAVQAGATLNNVTINEAGEYYGLWINGNGQTVTLNGGAINATNAGRGIKIADQYIKVPAQVTLNVTGTVFNTAKKAAVLVSSKAGAQITASNVNIENVAADKVNFVWVDEDWAQHFANVQVEGATKYQEGIEGFVAQRSNGASYKTLAAAITAATSGETITLIGDVKESVTIGKNINIDGKGRTITGTITLQGSNIVSEVKNVNFDGDNKTLYYAFSVRNTKNLTITDCTVKNYFSGLFYAPKSSTNVTVKNVTVEACGEYLAYMVSLSSATFENVTIKDSESGIIVTNSGPKKVTLKNCTMTGVDMPIEIKEKATANITFIFEGVNEMGKAEFYESQYVNVVAAAQVGTKVCGSLDTAFNAAEDGETVKMLGNVTLDTKTLATQNDGYAAIINVAGKAVTLDLNGKKITVDAAAADLANASGKMLLAVFSADLGGHLTLTDNSDAKNGAVTLNVNDANVYSMFASESGQSDKSKNGKLTVNGGNYTTVGKVSNAMFFTDANEVITVNGGNFYCDGATTTASYPWMFNTYLNNEIHVTVNGGTFNVDVNHQHRPFEVYVPETLAVNANGDGTWTVVPAVAYITEMLGGTVHESGDLEHKVGYATLAAAVEAAVEGDYVTLLADATGAGVVINKDVTIDFGGHTYTVNKAVGSEGTETLGLQILKGNDVTLTNGTLTSTAVIAGKEVKMLVQNYANLTLEDMNLVDATDHILYALSNNSGETLLTGNTNITTDAVAFDSYYSKSYDAPTVYVETEGRIEGAIEKNNGATIAISSGTFTAEILPEWCAEYYAPVQNADGTWTVEYRYIDEMTIVDGDYTEFVNEHEITVGTLTYERDFTNFSGWQTLFVPFEIPVEQLTDLGYEVAYFYDVHYDVHDEVIDPTKISSVHFIVVKQGTLRANFPYVIKRTSEANPLLSVTLYDAKLYSTAASELNTVESSSTTTRFVFAGTYKKMGRVALTGDDNTPCYRFNPQGQVQKMSATANLVPFRVCMYIKTKDGSPVILDEPAAPEYIKMRVIGEENEDGTTTIYDVNAEEAEEMIFDLSGRRVLETEKGGIYIKNGNKVYVK